MGGWGDDAYKWKHVDFGRSTFCTHCSTHQPTTDNDVNSNSKSIGLFFTLLLFTHLLYMKLFCYYCAMYRDFVTPLICELNCRSWLLSYNQINQKWFLHKILRDMTYFIIIYVGGETWNIKIDRFSSMLVTWSTASFHICFACDHKIMTFSHKNDGKACRHDIVKLYYSDVVCAQFSARWRLKVLSRTSHFIQID